jgi:hypothetical protein
VRRLRYWEIPLMPGLGGLCTVYGHGFNSDEEWI